MRLNRGTIVLLVASIAVIIVVLILNSNQAAAPGETLTPSVTAGPLFPGVDANAVVRLEVRDNTTGARTALTRANSDAAWEVDTTSYQEAPQADEAQAMNVAASSPYPVDQTAADTPVSDLTFLQASDSFQSDQLEDFGLAQPHYSAFITTGDSAIYALHVGGQNPNSTRYYVVVEQIGTAETTPEATIDTELDRLEVDTSLDTEEAPAESTEVTALAGAVQETTEEAEVTEAAATLRAAVEATNAAVGAQAEATGEATLEATAEATTEATGEATLEATGEATTEATGEATLEPLPEPLVTLLGTQTIYVVPEGVIDDVIALIATPPYILPTETPTPPPTANPYSEVDQTATAAVQQTATMQWIGDQLTATAQAQTTAEATPEATGEATAEATAAP